MKLTTKLPVLVLLALISLSVAQDDLAKNQLKDYPNTNEAPTMKEQIPDAKWKAPQFSRSLFETDPRRKIRKPEFMNEIKFNSYKLTRGETEQIFNFADQTHDDLIDQEEWDAFVTLYILPYEACDANKDYLLDVEELTTCFKADPKSSLLTFRRRFEEKKINLMMDIVSTRGNEMINFSDYLFIKKSWFAWQQCHSNSKYIAVSHFRCAFKLAIPQKYHMKMSMDEIYKIGLNLANDRALIELDYISYLRVLYFSYVFAIYGSPNDAPFLDKPQFIKAIREDRFPLNWEEVEVDVLYELINTHPFEKNITMGFGSWAFYFNLHRLFNKYSIERPLQLNPEEYDKLLGDPLSPFGITMAIDVSKSDFKEPQYLEASLVLQRKRLNEGNFYYSFLQVGQDASVTSKSFHVESTKNAVYQDLAPNADIRKRFFMTMTGTDRKYWNKAIFYRAFTMGNLYAHMCHDKAWIINVPYIIDNMMVAYDVVVPPIAQKLRMNYVVYKTLLREVSFDFVSFMALENWNFKVDEHTKSTNASISETTLKMILNDYGMKEMPDTVIDLTKTGYDAMRRRQYNPKNTLKNIIVVHATAAEAVRNKRDQEEFGVKKNEDLSRRFPGLPRRFQSSGNV